MNECNERPCCQGTGENKHVGMTYGEALFHLKRGAALQRAGWNGKGMFIFMRPEDLLHVDVVQKAISLPQCVKDYYKDKLAPVKVTAYLCMKAADDTIVNGWLASQTDMLAEDWQIVVTQNIVK